MKIKPERKKTQAICEEMRTASLTSSSAIETGNRFLPTISAYTEHERCDSGLVEAKGIFALSSQQIQVVVAKRPERQKKEDWVGRVVEAFGPDIS